MPEAATFTIPYLQVLDEKGHLDRKRAPKWKAEEAIRLYRAMVLAREVDDRRLKLQRQGRIGTFAPSTGQEAAACGPTLSLTDRDWLAVSFREARRS
jgi:TPP-dependent pyruvate/acetoin dehydrogenase alpha subunit